MKKYFKYIAVLLSFVMVFSLSGFAALQTATNVFAADSPSAGDNSGTGSGSPSAGDNTGDNSDDETPTEPDTEAPTETPSETPSEPETPIESDWEYTENEDGTLTLTKYKGKDMYAIKLEIPAQLDGRKVTAIDAWALFTGTFGDTYNINEIIVPEGITRINTYAFNGTHAKIIRLPQSLREVVDDRGDGGFSTYETPTKVYGYRNSTLEEMVDKSLWAVFYAIDEPYNTYDNFMYKENSDGTLTIVEYDGNDSDVTVPGIIDGKSVTCIEKCAFTTQYYHEGGGYWTEKDSRKTVTLPDGLKKIGAYAFEGNRQLESINIPDSVTTIGEFAFGGCNLKKLVIPASVVNIGNNAFYRVVVTDDGQITAGPIGSGCDVEFGWTEELPDYALYKLNITDITLPDTIKKIGNYSLGSNAFESVIVPEGVQSIGDSAFIGCSMLENITIPASVQSIGRYAFGSCSMLKNVTIPAGVSSVGDSAFANTSSLESVTFLGGNTEIGENIFYKYNGVQNTIIKGLTNSTAEEYAEANNIIFESIGVYDKPTEPENPSETPSKPETPIDSDVLDSINNGEKVVTKEVEAGNGIVVPTDFVAAAIEKGAQLVLEVKGTDGNPLVKYTFDGSKFTKAPDANFKLDVACGEKNAVTAKVKEQLNTADENSLFLCNFEHSGELNGELAVTVYPNYDNGTELKLFYYNEATGKAEDMGQTVKVENGEVTFTVTHFSSYLLVKASDIRNDATPSEPETTNPETTPSETQPETTPNQPETEEVQPESGSYVAPSTGAGTGTAAALVGVMFMACGAAGVCVGKRKK